MSILGIFRAGRLCEFLDDPGVRLIGLEAKLNQYQQGEDFIAEVERLGGGKDALDPVWRGPSWLPTLDEIRDPNEWVERVRLSEELVT